MKIAILDYSDSKVWIFSIPSNLEGEELNRYIEEELGFNLDEIEFMVDKNISIQANL